MSGIDSEMSYMMLSEVILLPGNHKLVVRQQPTFLESVQLPRNLVGGAGEWSRFYASEIISLKTPDG